MIFTVPCSHFQHIFTSLKILMIYDIPLKQFSHVFSNFQGIVVYKVQVCKCDATIFDQSGKFIAGVSAIPASALPCETETVDTSLH